MGTPNQYDWSKAKPVSSEGYNWSQAKPIQAAGAPSPQPKSFMQKVEGVGKGILGMVAAGGSPGAEAVEIGTDPNARRIAEPIAKAALNQLPTAGMVLGGMAGAAGGIETGPGALATGAAGAAAGGVLGKEAQQEIKEHLGISKRPSAKKEAKTLTGTAAMGAASEIGGQLATKAIERVSEAASPMIEQRVTRFMRSIIKPAPRRLIAGLDKDQTRDAIASAVAKVAGGAKDLSELKDNIQAAITKLQDSTQTILDSYEPDFKEVPSHEVSHAGTEPATPTAPAARTLTGGSKMLGTGTDIATHGEGAIEPSEGAVSGEIPSHEAAAAGKATVGKTYVKQGGINLRGILLRTAKRSIDNLSEVRAGEGEAGHQAIRDAVSKRSRMIYRYAASHFGDPENLTPSEALQLRRWMYGKMEWPKAYGAFKDDIYHEINNHIGAYLEPADRQAFEANNAAIHRLVMGKDATDSAAASLHSKKINAWQRYFLPTFLGSTAGAGIGYAGGGKRGAAEGAAIGGAIGSGYEGLSLLRHKISPFPEVGSDLSRIRTEKMAGELANKLSTAMKMPVPKKIAKSAIQAIIAQMYQ